MSWGVCHCHSARRESFARGRRRGRRQGRRAAPARPCALASAQDLSAAGPTRPARFVSRGTPPTSGPEVLFQNFTSGLPFFRLSAVNGTSGRHGGGGCRLIPVVSSAALVPRRPEQVRLVRCAARRSSRLQESYRAPAAPCALVAGLVPEVYLGNVVQAPWLRRLPRRAPARAAHERATGHAHAPAARARARAAPACVPHRVHRPGSHPEVPTVSRTNPKCGSSRGTF